MLYSILQIIANLHLRLLLIDIDGSCEFEVRLINILIVDQSKLIVQRFNRSPIQLLFLTLFVD